LWKCRFYHVKTNICLRERTYNHELFAYRDCRYVVTQCSRTEILKLVFQCVEVRTMENSPLTNYGRESMTLFSSVPNGSRMNVIWARAPLLFLVGSVVFSSAALLSPYCSSLVAFNSRRKKAERDQPSYNWAYRFLSGFRGVNPG